MFKSILLASLLALGAAGCATAESSDSATPAAQTEAKAKPAAAKPTAAKPAAAKPAAEAAKPAAPASEKPTQADAAAPEKTVLFFLNPNGRPCQMQDGILKEMGSSLTDKASVKYIPTTNPQMRPIFYKFGVRSLPTLVIVDKDNNELHRFTPGIKDAETILSAL